RLLKITDEKLEGKKILEIGSGWAAVMPYFMVFLGKARSVATFDLNHHFSGKNNKRLQEVFTMTYGRKVTPEFTKPFYLPQNITYYPDTNLLNVNLLEPDIVFSRFVMEHISQEDMTLMHQKFKRELKAGSIIVHLISPSDHRAYVDKNLSLQDFLRYSEKEWRKKQTKFDYHNRLRLPQYLDIFKAAGLDLLHVEFDQPRPDSPAFKKFKAIPLYKDFINFTEAELMASSINVVLKV